jgi:hypothetical protein
MQLEMRQLNLLLAKIRHAALLITMTRAQKLMGMNRSRKCVYSAIWLLVAVAAWARGAEPLLFGIMANNGANYVSLKWGDKPSEWLREGEYINGYAVAKIGDNIVGSVKSWGSFPVWDKATVRGRAFGHSGNDHTTAIKYMKGYFSGVLIQTINRKSNATLGQRIAFPGLSCDEVSNANSDDQREQRWNVVLVHFLGRGLALAFGFGGTSSFGTFTSALASA